MRAPLPPLQSLRPLRRREKPPLRPPLCLSLFSPPRETSPRSRSGFTLAEMLVAISVLALLAAFMGQLLNSSSALVSYNDKHMDADAQARGMLDRLAVDLGQIVKRTDVNYYLKNSGTTSPTGANFPCPLTQAGSAGSAVNDQMAFYSAVPGYESTAPSPISLVAYRVNSNTLAAERLGCGLLWNGASTTDTPMVFLPQSISSIWPNAILTTGTTTIGASATYETIAPGVFRFEYYYLLKGQTAPDGTVEPAILSNTPWYWDSPHVKHTYANGLNDVSAIGVAIAVIDPASRGLVNTAQLTTLAGKMDDFDATKYASPGSMETQWTSAVTSSSLPKIASSSIRVYGRMLYLSPGIQ